MPECHKCKLNGCPTKRCINCPGPSKWPNHHGEIIVSLDAMPESEVAKLTYSPPEPESPMAEFMRSWINLPSKSRDLVSFIMAERPKSCAEIARNTGVSRQAIHRRIVKISKLCPEIKSVLRLHVRALSPKTSALLIKKGINNG